MICCLVSESSELNFVLINFLNLTELFGCVKANTYFIENIMAGIGSSGCCRPQLVASTWHCRLATVQR